MKVDNNIDFDPPPPPLSSKQQYCDNYDIREYNHSFSTIDSDRACINVRSFNSSHSSNLHREDDASSSVKGDDDNDGSCSQEEDKERHYHHQQQGELDVSLTWSNAPGIDDSEVGSDRSKSLQFNNSTESFSKNNKEEKHNRNDTDTTVYEDDDDDADENLFLSWPELPVATLPQHELIQQRCSESVTNNNQQWWQFGRGGRQASDSDVILDENGDKSNGENNHNNDNNDDIDSKKSNDDSLVPENQQWWQFGRRRNTLPIANGGDATETRNSGEGEKSNDDGGDNDDDANENRRSSIESNSSATSSVDGGTSNKQQQQQRRDIATRRQPKRLLSSRPSSSRPSIEESDKSCTSSAVDDELNEWLYPRRGSQARQASVMSTRSSVTSSCHPPQSQDEDGVNVIVDKLKKSFVDLSPIDRVLLSDMASSKTSNRWRKPGISGSHNGVMGLKGSTLSMQAIEAQCSPHTTNSAPSREFNESLDSTQGGLPEIYWDSDKLSNMKGEGVSLARAKVHEEVSSIASSEHSGQITKRSSRRRRMSFTSSFLWWNNSGTIDEEDVDDNSSFKPEKIVPFKREKMLSRKASSGKLTSMKSSMRPKSIAISTPPNLLAMAKRRPSYDSDDCDDDEIYSKKNSLAKEDLMHETIVKEANEIMDSVNNSVIAMGMNAPFRPIEEICPPFQKLHKNLGAQMDALNAAIVRTAKSPTDMRQGMKKSKSKKFKASKMKSSQISMSSDNSFMDSSNQSSTMNILNDSEAMSKFILSQLALLQSPQSVDGSSIASVTPRSFYTSWLPNYMWYQTIAADASSIIRPTSLCSGTGITGDEQYLEPEMLKVFQMFSTYFVGSKHLFQESDEDDDNGMRRSYWMETIEEEIDSDDENSENSTSSDSEVSDESDMVYELGEADICHFVDAEQQIAILQKVITDLRKSQVSDRPILSIDASPGGNVSVLDESGRESQLSSASFM